MRYMCPLVVCCRFLFFLNIYACGGERACKRRLSAGLGPDAYGNALNAGGAQPLTKGGAQGRGRPSFWGLKYSYILTIF